ncbi:cholinesterase-like [Amphiura filiformis]|uniref:cholinesterase-like n=1 Tax=Amphiura filiformis TaxID=82378 RepID=UPI003B20F7B4
MIPQIVIRIVFPMLLLTVAKSQTQPKVSIPGLGVVIGETYNFYRDEYPVIDKNLDVYRGIPFAQPPVGQYRFAKPAPVTPWEGEYNATYFRKACLQTFYYDNNLANEDCLHLNIWTPNPSPANAPVMVFIHGWAFLYGSVVPEVMGLIYDGTALVGFHDIVYVSIHYRLNSYGFLATGDPELPGNYGLWDQLEALKWINQYISAFGGDPNKVTIFGQSTGAASIGMHLVSPHSWNYFNQGVMESGTGTSPWAIQHDIAEAYKEAEFIARDCGCDTSSSAAMVACLRDVPAKNISRATDKIILTSTTFMPLVAVVDGDFLSDKPLNLLQAGNFFQGNILLGTNKDDGTLNAAFAYPDQLPRRNPYSDRERFESELQDGLRTYRNDLILEGIMHTYVDWKLADDPDANYFFTYVDVMTDENYGCPTDTYARAFAEAGQSVFLYQFTHLPSNYHMDIPPWGGVAHGEELPCVFGAAFNPDYLFDQTPEERNLSLEVMTAWTNFAKTGSPNMDDPEKEWKPYTLPDLSYKDFSPVFTDKRALKSETCHMWNNFVPKMITFAADLKEEERQWREEFYDWTHESMPDWRDAFEEYEKLIPNKCNE